MDTLQDALTDVRDRWPEAAWLLSREDTGAIETLQVFETTLQRLSVPQRTAFLNGIPRNDEKDFAAKLRELVVYELLYRLKVHPTYHPLVYGDLSPDLSFLIDEKSFLADVFMSFTPSRILWPWDSRGSTDAGDKAKKIADRLSEKYTKYKKTGAPLVFFVFPGDPGVKPRDAELALYGASMGDPNLGENFPRKIQGLHTPGSFFLPDDNWHLIHEMVSAVVWCDWFYTESMKDPGMRLNVLVYHHWNPSVSIAPGSFRPFSELLWKRAGDCWEPSQTQAPNLAARFVDDSKIVVRKYTANQPW